MFFHVNTRKGCVVLTNSSVKHSFNRREKKTMAHGKINLVSFEEQAGMTGYASWKISVNHLRIFHAGSRVKL